MLDYKNGNALCGESKSYSLPLVVLLICSERWVNYDGRSCILVV